MAQECIAMGGFVINKELKNTYPFLGNWNCFFIKSYILYRGDIQIYV